MLWNYYEILEIPNFTELDEIKEIFVEKTIFLHPSYSTNLSSYSKNIQKFSERIEAFEVLSKNEHKIKYDILLNELETVYSGNQFEQIRENPDLHSLCNEWSALGKKMTEFYTDGNKGKYRKNLKSEIRILFKYTPNFIAIFLALAPLFFLGYVVENSGLFISIKDYAMLLIYTPLIFITYILIVTARQDYKIERVYLIYYHSD